MMSIHFKILAAGSGIAEDLGSLQHVPGACLLVAFSSSSRLSHRSWFAVLTVMRRGPGCS